VTTSKPYRDSTIHSRRSVSLELSLETQFFRDADRLSLRRADQAAMNLELFPRPHIRGAPLNSHLMVHVGAAIATSVDPG
jgi:hypothetical protein